MTSISIITVTYNSAEEIEDFVESVRLQNQSVELWIVDNASKDDTVSIINNLATKYPWVKVLVNTENVGLAAANNMPISRLSGEFTAIVNPDVVLHPDTLVTLKAFLQEHVDVVAVAPVNVYADGEPHTSFHRNWTLLHLFIWRMLPGRLTHAIYRIIRTYTQQDVLFASGSCIMMRTNDFQVIHGYDPMYFLAVEDVCDLCIRLRQGDPNKRVILTPTATITHLVSRSSVGVPLIVLWKSACGSIHHFNKHAGPLAGRIAYIIQFTSTLFRLTGSWLMSFRAPEDLNSYNNNLSVLRLLINENPLKSEKKGTS